jgi:hypothetical protein
MAHFPRSFFYILFAGGGPRSVDRVENLSRIPGRSVAGSIF